MLSSDVVKRYSSRLVRHPYLVQVLPLGILIVLWARLTPMTPLWCLGVVVNPPAVLFLLFIGRRFADVSRSGRRFDLNLTFTHKKIAVDVEALKSVVLHSPWVGWIRLDFKPVSGEAFSVVTIPRTRLTPIGTSHPEILDLMRLAGQSASADAGCVGHGAVTAAPTAADKATEAGTRGA
jgi:hypothetical protein